MTDQVDLEKLQELAKAATPGPWESGEPCDWDGVMQASVSVDGKTLTWDDHSGDVFKPQDAEFIAAANPAVVLELLASIAKVEALHTPLLNSVSALCPVPLCSCDKTYPCPTVRALRGEDNE